MNLYEETLLGGPNKDLDSEEFVLQMLELLLIKHRPVTYLVGQFLVFGIMRCCLEGVLRP